MPHNVHSPRARGVRINRSSLWSPSTGPCVPPLGDPAHADAVRCKREIAKASAKFAQAKMRILQKCEDGV